MDNTTKITLDANMIGETCILDGNVEFARLTHFIDGEELINENNRRRQTNAKMPVADRPYCSITLINPSVRDRGRGNFPTNFEKYVGDKCYQRKADGALTFNYEIKAIKKPDGTITKILPRVYTLDAATQTGTLIQGVSGDKEYRLPGEPAKGTKCTLEFRCVKTQHQYPAFVLSNIILEEPVSFRSNIPVPEDFRLHGITDVAINENAVATENTNGASAEAQADEVLPKTDNTPSPFANAQQANTGVYGTQANNIGMPNGGTTAGIQVPNPDPTAI